jgi:hypothetical protein
MRCPVPRIATLLALSLLLGTSTTILTAWTLRAWYQKFPTPVPLQTYNGTEGDSSFQLTFVRAPGRLSVVYNAISPPGTHWMMMATEGDPEPLPLTNEPAWAASARRNVPNLFGVGAYGWPLPALKVIQSRRAASTVYAGDWETPVSVGPAGPLRLPLSPIWPNLLADSALFAAAWFSLLAGLPALGRAHRRRQNRCPSCGYSLAGVQSPTCPECGARSSTQSAPVA